MQTTKGVIVKDQINTIRRAVEMATPHYQADTERFKQALTALDQIEKMVGSQVPVAWGMQHTDGAILDVISPEEHAREEGGYVVPLYRAAPVAQQPKCVCGQPTSLGVVHRTDGPCFVYEAQQPQADELSNFLRSEREGWDHRDPQPQAERELRKLLCITYAGAGAYMDDGEAQDNRAHPAIDFMRDTLAEIQHKMQQRSLTTPQQAEAVPQSISERFEAMHTRGDVWITTLAAAAIAQQKGNQ